MNHKRFNIEEGFLASVRRETAVKANSTCMMLLVVELPVEFFLL